jgi:hypothetical protein
VSEALNTTYIDNLCTSSIINDYRKRRKIEDYFSWKFAFHLLIRCFLNSKQVQGTLGDTKIDKTWSHYRLTAVPLAIQ